MNIYAQKEKEKYIYVADVYAQYAHIYGLIHNSENININVAK